MSDSDNTSSIEADWHIYMINKTGYNVWEIRSDPATLTNALSPLREWDTTTNNN